MKRGLMWTVAAALAVALLTLGVRTLNVAKAQEVRQTKDQERERQALYFQQAVGGSYLGAHIHDIDAEAAKRLGLSEIHGVLLSEVLEDTPAAQAGLQQDDVLLSWNGARLEGVAQLQRHMRETPAGRSVRLAVFRDGKARDVTVTLGKREGMAAFVGPDGVRALRVDPEDRVRMRERMDELRGRMRDVRDRIGPEGEAVRAYWMAVGERGRLGVSIQNLGDQLAEYFGVEQGALITSVLEDSPAQRADLKAGDVIVGVAGKDVADPADVMHALRDREAGPVDVRIVRDRKTRTISVELEERRSGASCVGEDCAEWEARWEEIGTHLEDWAEHFSDEWAEHAKSMEEWAKQLQHLEWTTPHIEVEPLQIRQRIVIGV